MGPAWPAATQTQPVNNAIHIALNNVYAKGDYCAEVYVGEPAQKYHLIIDSGSSTCVIHPDKLHPLTHSHFAPTSYMQSLRYGVGDWLGPVVHADIHVGHHHKMRAVEQVPVAIAEHQEASTFAKADGILGLAYAQLNIAHDMSGVARPATTWPWTKAWQERITDPDFITELRAQPKVPVQPFLDRLADTHQVANQFALLVHRSSIYQVAEGASAETMASHPLNKGILALGEEHLHHALHTPDYRNVKVVYDKYYNVNVRSVRVGEQAPIAVSKVTFSSEQPKHSNAIVDTGASAMVFSESLFKQVLADLIATNPNFASLLAHYHTFTGVEIGIPLAQLRLADWPVISFELEGQNGQSVELELTPDNYWQIQAPQAGQASFKITTLPGWGEQIIIGLPLLAEYFCIFARDESVTGCIKFADKVESTHRCHGHQ